LYGDGFVEQLLGETFFYGFNEQLLGKTFFYNVSQTLLQEQFNVIMTGVVRIHSCRSLAGVLSSKSNSF
jgi:hypothetical protein